MSLNDLYDLYLKYKNKYIRLKRIEIDNEILYFVRIKNLDVLSESSMFNKKDFCIFYDKDKDVIEVEGSKKYKYVTKGGQGTVCFMKSGPYDLALKFTIIPKYLINKENIYNPVNKAWRELYVLRQSTKMVKSGRTQNLPILYKSDIDVKQYSEHSTLLLYSELASGDLLKWLQKEHSVKDWKSMLFQVWHAVYILNKRMEIVHNDLRLPNILYFDSNRRKGSFRYIMGSETYYLSEPNHVFILWDFGSSDILSYSGKHKHLIKNKLQSFKDLHFIHDLYKRLRVLALNERYSIEELEDFLSKNKKDSDYVKNTRDENRKRFTKDRFEEKYKISLAYYIMETNRFEELYEARKEGKMIKLAPFEIDQILKRLSEEFNYDYKDAISYEGPRSRKIPDPRVLINEFLPEYKQEQSYDITFSS